MFGVPRYSDIQKILKRSFFKKEGLIYVFTEDKKEDQIFYELLFKRLDNEFFKIACVQPLGSRANVMKRSLEDRNPQIPTLYIIDGDIDLIMKDPIESHNLIGLDRYCIENYLCCENGIINLLQTNFGTSIETNRSNLEFRSTLNKFGQEFLKITIRYFVAQELECSTGFKKANDFFYIRAGGVFKPHKQEIKQEINRLETLIKDKLKQNGIKAFKKEMDRLISDVETKNSFSVDHYLKVISGKDFVLPVLEQKLKMIERRLTGW
jgi:hypothetical protein